MDTLKNKKVYVGKFSKEIQEKVFSLGWSWSGLKIVSYLDAPFIFFSDNCNLICSRYVDIFNKHEYEEVTPEWILELPEPQKNILENENIYSFHITKKGKIIKDFKYTHSQQKWFRQFNSKEEAEAYKILPELLYWRDKYNEGWKPNWNIKEEPKYCIENFKNTIKITDYCFTSKILAFKTRKIRDKFLEDFKEELEIVKPLL